MESDHLLLWLLLRSCNTMRSVSVRIQKSSKVHVWLIGVGLCIEVRHSTSSKGRSSDLLFNPDHQFTKRRRQKKVFETIRNIFPEKKL